MFIGADLGYLPKYQHPDGVTGEIRRSEKLEESEKGFFRRPSERVMVKQSF